MNSEEKTPIQEDISGPVVIKAKAHLPVNGIFIPYIISISAATLIGVVLGHIPPITAGIPSSATIRTIYLIIGIVLILAGSLFASRANSDAHIKEKVLQGKLVTDSVYAWCRHPLYSGILLTATGVLFVSGNAFFYVIPIIGYFVLSYFLAKTEEQWLLDMFPEEYPEYSEKVYRLFPFPPKKK